MRMGTRERDRDRDRASPSSLPTDGNGSGASRLRRFRLSAEEFQAYERVRHPGSTSHCTRARRGPPPTVPDSDVCMTI